MRNLVPFLRLSRAATFTTLSSDNDKNLQINKNIVAPIRLKTIRLPLASSPAFENGKEMDSEILIRLQSLDKSKKNLSISTA